MSQPPQVCGSSNETQALPHWLAVAPWQLEAQSPDEQNGVGAVHDLVHEPQVVALVKSASQPSSHRALQWPRPGRQALVTSQRLPRQRTVAGSTPMSAPQSTV